MSFANHSACRICSTHLLRLPSESAVSSRNLRRRSVALRVLAGLEVGLEGLGHEPDPELEVMELVPELLLLDLAESRLDGGLSKEESLSNLAFMLLTLDLWKRTWLLYPRSLGLRLFGSFDNALKFK